jgi:hypothetical protein
VRRDERPGALPAPFMVYFVLALALFQQDSYDDVAENLVGALQGAASHRSDKRLVPDCVLAGRRTFLIMLREM